MTQPSHVRLKVKVNSHHHQPEELMYLLKGFDLVVATRMHVLHRRASETVGGYSGCGSEGRHLNVDGGQGHYRKQRVGQWSPGR